MPSGRPAFERRRPGATWPTAYCGSPPPHRCTWTATGAAVMPSSVGEVGAHLRDQRGVVGLQRGGLAEPPQRRAQPHEPVAREVRPLRRRVGDALDRQGLAHGDERARRRHRGNVLLAERQRDDHGRRQLDARRRGGRGRGDRLEETGDRGRGHGEHHGVDLQRLGRRRRAQHQQPARRAALDAADGRAEPDVGVRGFGECVEQHPVAAAQRTEHRRRSGALLNAGRIAGLAVERRRRAGRPGSGGLTVGGRRCAGRAVSACRVAGLTVLGCGTHRMGGRLGR